MIETYKRVSGKYNPLVASTMNTGCLYLTRENDKRIQKSHAIYDLRKYWFTNRVVNMWNGLPDRLISAHNTNIII